MMTPQLAGDPEHGQYQEPISEKMSISLDSKAHDLGYTGYIHDGSGTLSSLERSSYPDEADFHAGDHSMDFEQHGGNRKNYNRSLRRKFRPRSPWKAYAFCFAGWLLALYLFLKPEARIHAWTKVKASLASIPKSSSKAVTLDSVLNGEWYPKMKQISWIQTPEGQDGMVLGRNVGGGKDYLIVEDVRSLKAKGTIHTYASRTLMKKSTFKFDGKTINPYGVTPSSDLKKVLVMSDKEKNWRHSSTGKFWIFDVESQTAEPLDPADPDGRIQLATWSPASDSVAFTRSNNLFIRHLGSKSVKQITFDGGANLFYGIPDWVYEEEVFAGNKAIWWSRNGSYIAFLRSENSGVPEFPVQYFVSRPSGKESAPGLESYPDVRKIKYPKAGAPNPSVDILFFDTKAGRVLDTEIKADYTDVNRLITEVVWAGDSEILVRETDRTSDTFKLSYGNVRTGDRVLVRSVDVKAIDGGWYDPGDYIKIVPGDPRNGREHDGYIDSIIYEGYNHLAYFTPIANPIPIILTKGNWEVVGGAASVDLKNNRVYFVSTEAGPIQRHVYSVKLDGTDLKPFTNDSQDGYYDASFSTGSGYALLTSRGPDIPIQKVVSTPSLSSSSFSLLLEDNSDLAKKLSNYDLPTKHFSTVTIDGFELQIAEHRPHNFNSSKQYPVIFYLYQGPGSQQVDKHFSVSFQTYLASLGYIVLTLDGRGTGFSGRKTRSIIRDNLGYWESHDQIYVAKLWASKPYIDAERLAVWGWSYGGFMTLKILETDAGQTFKYGMAVAPVTDWRFYDSVYTERYMHTPQTNAVGYNRSAINNATALGQNVRFLLMHGTGDDNVHAQNSLVLLDKLDLAGVSNYDFHAFPDSDHSISFHNANKMVYGRLSSWLINAFNGEYLNTNDPKPRVERRGRRNGGLQR